VGLLAIADQPSEYAARDAEWGMAYAELQHSLPGWASAELEGLADRSDAVIAFPHWGPNMATTPAR
jgi:hypothetical protein